MGEKRYNISPLIKDRDGVIKAYPIIDGKSFLSETYDKLKDDLYMCGRSADLSPELREIFNEDDDESYGTLLRRTNSIITTACFSLIMERA